MNHRFQIVWVLLLVLMISGCSGGGAPNRKIWVEVSPDTWLEVAWEPQLFSYTFQWKGKKVQRKIKVNEAGAEHLLCSLREKDGVLYTIVLDREEVPKSRFIFSKLNAEGDGFREIKAELYPKVIATQNMQLDGLEGIRDVNGNVVDFTKILQELDVGHAYFFHTLTANVWVCLETGKQKHELSAAFSADEITKLAKNYAKKYNPIPLKNLVRKDEGQ